MTTRDAAVFSVTVTTEAVAQTAGSLEKMRFEALKGAAPLYTMSGAQYFKEPAEVQ